MSSTAAPLTIPRLLAGAAAEHRENLAVVDGDLRVSYRELADAVARTARAYVATGICPGDRVAVWAPNRFEFMLAMLGAQSAGACVVPINTRYRGREAAVILERSRASLLVVAGGFLGNDFAAMVREAVADSARPDEDGPVPGLPHLRTLVDITATESSENTLAWPDFLARADEVSPERGAEIADAVTPDDVCDIMFTSGTTGVPKGVLSAHRQTIGVARVWAQGAKLSPADNYAIVNPFFHGFGYKAGMIAALEAGSTIYPLPTFDVDRTLELIASAKISVLPGAPTIFTSLLDHPRLAEFDLSSLRFSIAGAASVPESLFQRMRDELGFETVAQAYGLTECVVATQSRPNEDPAHIAQTTGPGVPGIEVRVVDAEQKEVPVGEDGEILLRGDNVMLGYFEDEAATRAAIDTEGWFHTGDVGRLDEHGCLKITDRIKDMIIVGGFNVYPAEVENTLAAHPGVSESAVVGIPDARLGNVPCAYVVPRRDVRPTPEEIIAFCKTRLANFKVPSRIVLVDELPKNASGKILKTDLRGGAAA
ncbi:AMP-binding protein [Streptomyces sp. NPDC046821]|uniref:AMP-binding protein n=1 Tax=Streptomyces sp. NPDC046821 TaxID=3154702 RepID=UPI0033D576C4